MIEENGQSSVLVALTAVVLVALLAFVANIGQVIHDKMLTQAVADAVALSAANVQAVGLNEIADLNAEIQLLNDDLDEDLRDGSDIGFLASQGMKTFWYYYRQILYARDLQDEANTEFAKMAREAGQKVLDVHNANYNKLHPKVSAASHNGLKPKEHWTMEELLGSQYPNQELGVLDNKWRSHIWWIWVVTRYPPSTQTQATFLDTRGGIGSTTALGDMKMPIVIGPLRHERRLGSATKVYYRVRVKREPIRALVDMENYGFSVNIPEIIAYSQAQPHKGNIYEGEPEYEARLAPLWQTYPNETTDSEYLQLVNEFKH
ncbi:Tad domain-containing protein [Desulfogranum japonicum]|uniref:Tad domain-containing protein n=1 Tax=Desulfogranum japonicum TaxID=231447 RepID=UPI0012946FAD|nr:Tad domain-containing protein [Desulfogranum japonicum]